MKMMKKLLIASAIGMAFAGPASALTTGTTSNGSLFLAVWDNSAAGTYSYVQDLGYNINTFLPNGNVAVSALDGGPAVGDKTPVIGMNQAFSTSFLSSFTGLTSDLRWNVVAYDNQASNFSTNTRRLVTTTQIGTANAGAITNSGLNTVTSNVGTAATTLNCGTALIGCSSTSTLLKGATFGNTLGNGGLSTSQGLGGTLEMMYITQVGTTPTNGTAAAFDFFDNAYGRATWNLASNGTLTYDIDGAPAAVPLPAAVWLFGSGLLGLVGIGRRKSKSA